MIVNKSLEKSGYIECYLRVCAAAAVELVGKVRVSSVRPIFSVAINCDFKLVLQTGVCE